MFDIFITAIKKPTEQTVYGSVIAWEYTRSKHWLGIICFPFWSVAAKLRTVKNNNRDDVPSYWKLGVEQLDRLPIAVFKRSPQNSVVSKSIWTKFTCNTIRETSCGLQSKSVESGVDFHFNFTVIRETSCGLQSVSVESGVDFHFNYSEVSICISGYGNRCTTVINNNNNNKGFVWRPISDEL